MATIVDNGDGTFTIKRPGQPDEIRAPGGGDETPPPGGAGGDGQEVPVVNPGAGATGGGEGDIGNISAEQQSDIDFILEQVEIFLGGDTANGISPNDAKRALASLGLSQDRISGLIDPLLPTSIENQAAGAGIASAAQPGANAVPPGSVTPTGDIFGGIDFSSPEERALDLQFNRSGRTQLFNEFISQNLPTFGGGIARRAAQSRFSPFNAAFLLGGGVEGTGEGFGPSASSFLGQLGGNVPTGADIRGGLSDILGIIGGDPSGFTPASVGFQEFLSDPNTSRSTAFDVANASFGLGRGNPFRNAFSNVLGRKFDAFLGGGGSELDFLNTLSNQGIGGLF